LHGAKPKGGGGGGGGGGRAFPKIRGCWTKAIAESD